MKLNKYSVATLEMICRPDGIKDRLPLHVLREDGVFLADEPVRSWAERGVLNSPAIDVLEWHPRQDRELPALPIPFSVDELAAFTLAGGGSLLFEPFEYEDEPDEQALASLGDNADKAREAIREACRLRKAAIDQFGVSAEGVRQAVDWLLRNEQPPQVESAPKHQYRQRLQERAVLDKLAELGFDALNLPVAPNGKPSVPKQQVKEALGFTKDIMKKVWGRLRAEGLIKDA